MQINACMGDHLHRGRGGEEQSHREANRNDHDVVATAIVNRGPCSTAHADNAGKKTPVPHDQRGKGHKKTAHKNDLR